MCHQQQFEEIVSCTIRQNHHISTFCDFCDEFIGTPHKKSCPIADGLGCIDCGETIDMFHRKECRFITSNIYIKRQTFIDSQCSLKKTSISERKDKQYGAWYGQGWFFSKTRPNPGLTRMGQLKNVFDPVVQAVSPDRIDYYVSRVTREHCNDLDLLRLSTPDISHREPSHPHGSQHIYLAPESEPFSSHPCFNPTYSGIGPTRKNRVPECACEMCLKKYKKHAPFGEGSYARSDKKLRKEKIKKVFLECVYVEWECINANNHINNMSCISCGETLDNQHRPNCQLMTNPYMKYNFVLIEQCISKPKILTIEIATQTDDTIIELKSHVSQLHCFLVNIKMQNYYNLFCEQAITYDMLSEVTNDELKNEIGVKLLGHRKLIMKAIVACDELVSCPLKASAPKRPPSYDASV